MMTLDLSPGSWRHGIAPALKVEFRSIPPEAGQLGAQPASPAREKRRGIHASRTQEGSSVPLAPRYYRNSEVDAQAIPLSTGPLIYPELAYLSKLEGSVRARVFISEEGVVESVEVLEARPRSGIFEDAALEALSQVRYKPAEISGARVKSQKLIEVKFNPRGDEPPPADSD
jgi:TonB family protein